MKFPFILAAVHPALSAGFHCFTAYLYLLKNHAAADLFPGGQFYLLYCIVVKLPAMRFFPYFAAE